MSITLRNITLTLITLTLTLPVAVHAQQPERKIGFGIQVYTDGFFGSTVTKVSVTQVLPDSQAFAGGVASGDEVIRVDGNAVPGNNASKLKEHMDFVPDVPKKLTFRRSGGIEYDVIFIRAGKGKSSP